MNGGSAETPALIGSGAAPGVRKMPPGISTPPRRDALASRSILPHSRTVFQLSSPNSQKCHSCCHCQGFFLIFPFPPGECSTVVLQQCSGAGQLFAPRAGGTARGSRAVATCVAAARCTRPFLELDAPRCGRQAWASCPLKNGGNGVPTISRHIRPRVLSPHAPAPRAHPPAAVPPPPITRAVASTCEC